MKDRYLSWLLPALTILTIVATIAAIVDKRGQGAFLHTSVRGERVEVYGQGPYRDMPAEVAVQGIAQDVITLMVALPLLWWFWIRSRMGQIYARIALLGVLGYFLVTYLFYTAMAAYQYLFLLHVALLGLSFFAFARVFRSLDVKAVDRGLQRKKWLQWGGRYLQGAAVLIGLLWLSRIVPPLVHGTVYPAGLGHMTTLVVQGFDLALLLPLSFISGSMMVRQLPEGKLWGTTYLVFLSIMMTALTAKIIAMALQGVNVIPVVFIMPVFAILAITLAIGVLRSQH